SSTSGRWRSSVICRRWRSKRPSLAQCRTCPACPASPTSRCRATGCAVASWARSTRCSTSWPRPGSGSCSAANRRSKSSSSPTTAERRRPVPRDRVVLRATAARALRSGVLWGSVFAVFIVSSAYSYATSYATVAARARFSTSLAGNAGLAALFGTARRLDTVAGFTAWRSMGFLTLVGAVWGLLLATRLTRGEEDEGRWEVLLAGPTSRGAAAAQAAAGIGAGMAVCWAMVAVATMSAGASRRIGFAAGASCFLALAVVGCAAVFAAVGLGAAVLGVAYLLRVVADAGAGVTWVRWATPLGWAEDMRPLTGSRGAAVAPLVAAVAALTTGGVIAAARRDLGASM